MSYLNEGTLYDGFPDHINTGSRIIIDRPVQHSGEYELWISARDSGYHMCLPRAVFNELSEASVEQVRRSLNELTQGEIDRHMSQGDIIRNRKGYAELSLALAQARVSELELQRLNGV